jgi:hypothetical protein
VELRRAVRGAEGQRDAAAAEACEALAAERASQCIADREYWAACGELARQRAEFYDGLARFAADWLGQRVAEETRRWVEAEALAWLDRAA